MKRIRQIIESFLNIGRDPNAEIASAWARITISASSAADSDIALIDRVVAGVLQHATELKAKTSKASGEAAS